MHIVREYIDVLENRLEFFCNSQPLVFFTKISAESGAIHLYSIHQKTTSSRCMSQNRPQNLLLCLWYSTFLAEVIDGQSRLLAGKVP